MDNNAHFSGSNMNQGSSQPGRRRGRGAGLLLVGFLAGAVGGGATSYILDEYGTELDSYGGSTIIADDTERPVTIQEVSATTQVVEQVEGSVVNILVSQEVASRRQQRFSTGDPFFDDFFGTTPESADGEESGTQSVEVASGTGFVVSEDGLIVTNRHVVGTAADGSTYEVVFDNGDSYEAEVLARDELTDLALLKIDAKDLSPLELADSDALQVGQTVIAIGNTLGEYDNTVTKGIVSGLSRNLGGQYSGLVQTDAAINEGNSGGPLLNLQGQVIGINTAVDRSGEGIGFAIPINDAKVAIESVRETGRIVRAGLGVRYVQLDEEIAQLNNLEYQYGAMVRGSGNALGVIEGAAADKAGIEEGDIILEVAGTRVDDENSLASLIRDYAVGDVVAMKIYDTDLNEERDIDVTLEELPSFSANTSDDTEQDSENSEE